MSLLFPTLLNGLDLPIQYFVSLYVSKTSQAVGGRIQGTQVRALGQDTQLYLSHYSFGVEIMLQAGGPQVTCIHIYRAEGQDYIDFLISILRRSQLQKEVQYKRQTGQDRQPGYPRTGVSAQRPKGIFPPIDVVRMLSRSITSYVRLGGFLYLYHGSSLHGL